MDDKFQRGIAKPPACAYMAWDEMSKEFNMVRAALTFGLLTATVFLAGCQTWHSPYRGNEWRMDQVMDGDPYRVGDGQRNRR
ncbi:hypothetical protein [Rhizobium sp. AU243]|uniref:hypothetical protein n=1 Tax=Rhizobium sp. AU243 TaxID=2303425 RepID=UPI0010CB345E|nr:hypothetical protein [Rhizobium sp. AU243]